MFFARMGAEREHRAMSVLSFIVGIKKEGLPNEYGQGQTVGHSLYRYIYIYILFIIIIVIGGLVEYSPWL